MKEISKWYLANAEMLEILPDVLLKYFSRCGINDSTLKMINYDVETPVLAIRTLRSICFSTRPFDPT